MCIVALCHPIGDLSLQAIRAVPLGRSKRLCPDIHRQTNVRSSIMRPMSVLQITSLPAWSNSDSPSRPVYYSSMVVKRPIDSPGELPSPGSPGTPIAPMNGLTSPSVLMQKQPRTRRKRCGVCEGCTRREDCGACTVCLNGNRSSNTKCKLRRCELLKRRPSLVRYFFPH